jgi:hypothetical protein
MLRRLAVALLIPVWCGCVPASDDDDDDNDDDDVSSSLVMCGAPELDGSGDDCTVVLSDCDDGRLHELLCYAVDNGDGAYDERMVCECAEDQAVHGATILEGHTCGSILGAPATIEAGFRACDLEISINQ